MNKLASYTNQEFFINSVLMWDNGTNDNSPYHETHFHTFKIYFPY